ncbi:MAG: hypothetical protein JSR82_11835 [Verrucomicrobia bacterium]|nr:hypothetical protein [Verrucomicrobiota bacterium]
MRARWVISAIVTFAVVVLAALGPPLRPSGGDTVPGRLGAAALACEGTLDLRRVEYVEAWARAGRLPYWAQANGSGEVLSTFGPGPAVVGALAFATLPAGKVLTDRSLQRRARWAAATCAGLAALAVFLAVARGGRVIPAVAAGLVFGLSFAGAATLGQALWQQTVSMVALGFAVAATLHADRSPGLGLLAPTALLCAVLLRPPLLPMALVLAAVIVKNTRRARGAGFLLAFVLAMPWLVYHVRHHGGPLPLGQLVANRALAGGSPFRLSSWPIGVAGLLASPARGLLWFAPIAVFGAVAGFRARGVFRGLALAAAVHVAFVGTTFKWWGGLCFGPRLVAEAALVGIVLAFLAPATGKATSVRALCAALTVVVGAIGLLRYDPVRWEMRRDPDHHPGALWDPVDTPLVALFVAPRPPGELLDAPLGPFVHCDGRTLRRAPPP